MRPYRFVTHSKKTLSIARRYGWLPGARYTNLRDVRDYPKIGFLDIDWKNYDYRKHLEAVRKTKPLMTVARDVEDIANLPSILAEAKTLVSYSKFVIVVPKDKKMAHHLHSFIPEEYILGYSVPTRYGGTMIGIESFKGRPVHLLGGRPDRQREAANHLHVVSFDCNRFTLDAAFGDYFDGERFRPHPVGGYERCLEDSLTNINTLWTDYEKPSPPR